MIAKLQKRFVRIAMLSVLLVMLLLSVIVDVTSLCPQTRGSMRC